MKKIDIYYIEGEIREYYSRFQFKIDSLEPHLMSTIAAWYHLTYIFHGNIKLILMSKYVSLFKLSSIYSSMHIRDQIKPPCRWIQLRMRSHNICKDDILVQPR